MTALRCSFCNRTVGKVERIVSGPDRAHPVYICNECVGVCVGILQDGTGKVDAAERFKQRRLNLLDLAKRPFSIIPVLIIAGVFYSAAGYYIGGVAKMEEMAAVWFSASVIAVLIGRWLRKPSEQVNK